MPPGYTLLWMGQYELLVDAEISRNRGARAGRLRLGLRRGD